MKKNIFIVALVLIATLLSSCKDFLNQPTYDAFEDSEYWKNEQQARTYMYGFYTTVFAGYGSSYSHGPFYMGQTTNDDFSTASAQTEFSPSSVGVTHSSWSFTNIRKINYAIAAIPRIQEDEATINHWLGVARFFRACYYANMVFVFGDVPYFDRVPALSNEKEDLDYLYKDRDRRTYVDSMIIADFQFAMKNVRANDGALQVNKYVVAGMASRFMLREGTFLKYHNIDLSVAEYCLRFAHDAAAMVMSSGKYSIAPSYVGLFSSEDLAGNPEVLMYRSYTEGTITHSTQKYCVAEPQTGISKSLAMAFLTSDGLPVYSKDEFWIPRNAEAFFANRDPRLAQIIRPRYYFAGLDNTPYNYAKSGFSCHKFVQDAGYTKVSELPGSWADAKNSNDAPCLRYAEVLLNYVEAAYELHQLNSKYVFAQSTLDSTINVIRDRADVMMPHLEMQGERPAVNGVTFDDPERVAIENETGEIPVSALLWEIRRERRVELCFEGFRLNDLKRWKRLDYMWNGCNPDIRYGAYVVAADYTADELKNSEITFDDPSATEGWVLRNTDSQRARATEKNYIDPVPSGQITLYESKGYKLTQNPEWK